eukprot:TRINITY_DN3351_c0_g1_i2.p1 TRINITY_DN3351_c0_g1~~TRINITY_DN3351_c0_g1_i2.p1  ORF type:complete len:803 (+),score=106.51 TRINITY_DN3351_c0_g1_i2:339-2747(+)
MDSSTLTITTSKLQLVYKLNQYPTSDSLQIQGIGKDDLDFKGLWHYGQDDDKNLYGTIRSLDQYQPTNLNCTDIGYKKVHDEYLHCSWGLISRNGWHVVNDSQNEVFGGANDWALGQNKDTIDSYFFGHGLNYKQALNDYIQVAGKVPMIPRYGLGIFWTRWYAWDDYTVRSVVEEYQRTSTPLDVYVFDMNWHVKLGWGAYSFDKNLFPFPPDMMQFLKDSGLHVAMNIHDDDGIMDFEDQFVPACQALGLDPNKTGQIKFDSCESYNYSTVVEDILLKPIEDLGTEIWWIDWQQGGVQGGCVDFSFNPTIWLNKQRVTDAKRRYIKGVTTNPIYRRSMVLGRWGGLGNHRYQAGFSGDVPGIDWNNLAFQPYFSATSANVGYGMWSNDLTALGDNSELYIRWTQFIAISGIIRFHERGRSSGGCAEDIYPDVPGGDSSRSCSMWVPYDIPNDYLQIQRNTLKLRISLIPYIYSELQKYHTQGYAYVRPLYYDYPTEQSAYECLTANGSSTQYMFGDNMMVAPIVKAVSTDDRMVQGFYIWMPPNQNWVEQNSGLMISGGSNFSKLWDVSEIPMFVKAGAVIPKKLLDVTDIIGTAQQNYTKLLFEVYPGTQSGSYALYEDDGYSIAYLTNNKSSFINFQYTRDSSSFQATIATQINQPWYDQPLQRTIGLEIYSSYPPNTVSYTVNGQSAINIPYKQNGKNTELHWHYCPSDIAVVIIIPNIVLENNQYVISMSGNFANNNLLYGLKGGIGHSEMAKENLDPTHSTPATIEYNNASLILAAGMGYQLSHYADPQLSLIHI